MSQQEKFALPGFVRIVPPPYSKDRARFLIHSYYTEIYGEEIREETVRSLRFRICEIQIRAKKYRIHSPILYRTLIRQCVDFERIAALVEML